MYQFTYDDEDRLVQSVYPGGITDTFSYNGLGLRVGKTDSTGTYSYVCDGTSPGSPVLSDGHALYTPGLSENRGGTASYYSNDRLGNLWTLDGSSKGQLFYQDFAGFGSVLSQAGTGSGSAFGYGGGNGCQTEADTGLVLMGHRYYDTRIGRFISQDPAGDGDNWYSYAGNDPIDEIDPTGLSDGLPGSLGAPDSHYGMFEGGPDDMRIGAPDDGWIEQGLELDTRQRTRTGTEVWTPDPTAEEPGHGSWGTVWGPWSDWNVIDRTPLDSGMFADNSSQSHQSLGQWFWELIKSGGMAGNHNFHEIPIMSAGPGKGPGNNANDTVEKILKGKQAGIKNAPLEPGSPSWQDINKMQWKDILKGAEEGKPGYGTFKKLLNDGRFNR